MNYCLSGIARSIFFLIGVSITLIPATAAGMEEVVVTAEEDLSSQATVELDRPSTPQVVGNTGSSRHQGLSVSEAAVCLERAEDGRRACEMAKDLQYAISLDDCSRLSQIPTQTVNVGIFTSTQTPESVDACYERMGAWKVVGYNQCRRTFSDDRNKCRVHDSDSSR